MIFYTTGMIKQDSVIVDSVRAQIVNQLKDSKPKRFKEIKKLLHKHDTVINRELKTLIKMGFVKKTGKNHTTTYSLDITNETVQEYLKRLEVSLPSNADIHRVDFTTPSFENMVVEPQTVIEIKAAPDGKHSVVSSRFLTEDENLREKEEYAKPLLDKTRVYTVGEKIEGYETALEKGFKTHKDWSLSDVDFIEMVCIIDRILSNRAVAYIQHELEKDPELKNVEGKDLYEKTKRLEQKVFAKPLQLVIKYDPRFNPS